MIKKILTLISIVFFALSAQSQVAMGKWRTHFAFNTINQLAQSENKVFAVSDGKLFSIDKRDKSIEYYSKLTGLSGTSISNLAYDTSMKSLLIIYNDGNIDFMTASGVKNLPDFYNKQMSADKSINHINIDQGKAYLSAKFGILVLNMAKMEIKDTYYIGNNASELNIQSTCVHKNIIYAVTAGNVYAALANDPQLINYELWSKMSNLPGSGNFQSVLSFGNWLILQRGNKLFKQDTAGNWSGIDADEALKINVSNNRLICFTSSQAYVFDEQFNRSAIAVSSPPTDAVYDNTGNRFWMGGDPKGLAEISDNQSPAFYKPDGPATNNPYKLKFGGEKLFVVQGGGWDIEYQRPGVIMIFENNQWRNIENSVITQATNFTARDFMDIGVNPTNNKNFYISSFGYGVYEFREDQFYKWHNVDNSTIETILPNGAEKYYYMRMNGGNFDKTGNIWFSNSMTPSGIQILKSDGTWTKMSNQKISGLPTLSEILISNKKESQKWMLSKRVNTGVVVFDDGGTIDSSNDDKYTYLQSLSYTANNEVRSIAPSIFQSIAQDKNGAIWIGTNMGPIIINNPDKAFDTDFMVSRIIIPRNDGTGLGDFLLEDQEITAIAIDGANRKWIGTKETGIYLMSDNGQEMIQHFTSENSPLLSNEILSIAINPKTGEVFFGTALGLISFQSDAATGNSNFLNVHAYPNPVRENFDGVITIAGLVNNTQVKITDTAGNLVFETYSNGSIATWDGRNKSGQKVSTGVYVAMCIAPDGTESANTKILIIN